MSFNISLIPFCFSHQTVTAVTDLAIKLSEVFVLTNEFVLWQSLQAEKLVDFLITAWILMRLPAEVHSILSFCEHSNVYWGFFLLSFEEIVRLLFGFLYTSNPFQDQQLCRCIPFW